MLEIPQKHGSERIQANEQLLLNDKDIDVCTSFKELVKHHHYK
jgi:hypothetical protein